MKDSGSQVKCQSGEGRREGKVKGAREGGHTIRNISLGSRPGVMGS